jgi:hypothetical protein
VSPAEVEVLLAEVEVLSAEARLPEVEELSAEAAVRPVELEASLAEEEARPPVDAGVRSVGVSEKRVRAASCIGNHCSRVSQPPTAISASARKITNVRMSISASSHACAV